MMNSSTNNRLWYAGGVGLMLAAWQLLSMIYSTVIVPSPIETWRALAGIIASGELTENLKITFSRQFTGLLLGLALGVVTGVIAGIYKKIELITQPAILFLLSVPAIIFVTMAMVWFGMGTKMAVFLVALLVFPVMHTNTAAGIHSIAPELKQMAAVYRIPPLKKLTKIYLPGMRGHLITGFSLGMAASLRLTIMSEMLGAADGMGQRIFISRVYLETEKLFAWVVVLLIILVLLEFLTIRPLKKWTRTG
ncbi:MAG: ABC transporter permease subunit [Desulfotomaculaceae bacterium]|nr:ABC transporter permease subunit [Desulfotomaculaceae bacterium]